MLYFTFFLDPAPVSSEINVTYVDDGTRNVSWLVPLPDYCIAGYNVLVYEMVMLLLTN